jgi:hypothetical protein
MPAVFEIAVPKPSIRVCVVYSFGRPEVLKYTSSNNYIAHSTGDTLHPPGDAGGGIRHGNSLVFPLLLGQNPSNSNDSHGSAKLKVLVYIAQTSTANEGQVRIHQSLVPIYVFLGMKLCMPPYFQNRIIMFSLPIPTLICL